MLFRSNLWFRENVLTIFQANIPLSIDNTFFVVAFVVLDFWEESILWLVLNLFPCGRLHSLIFVHGQNLSQGASNQQSKRF